MQIERKAAFARWFSAGEGAPAAAHGSRRIDWLRVLPFILVHVACIGVIWVGWSPVALVACVALYLLRMFAITAFYHRYFSHRAFRTHRAVQFAFALLGASAAQRGPMWWAGHHRHHHANADGKEDVHSPRHGFLWSHMGWFLTTEHFPTRAHRVADLAAFPELRFLDRFDVLIPAVLALVIYGLGAVLERFAPQLGTNGPQLLVWGFFVSTVTLYHATFTVNSLTHRFGRRRFETTDESRNNWWIALLTLGEGWHNNHHRYPLSARQGFRWWELDLTYCVLRLMAALGLVWDLHPVPAHLRRRA